ncbi:MAG: DUF2975 domain-containing protein [Anaerolineaceae bacterium]|nr:DUF2975 domain-containing protein [Anaerolineaceae bacterium]
MQKKDLINYLRGIILGFAVFGGAVYSIVLPALGRMMAESLPYFAAYYPAWLIFICLTAIPCFAVLFYAWKVTEEMKIKTAFTEKTASHFKKMSYWALGDTLFFAMGNLVFFLLKGLGIVYFFASLVAVFMGFAVMVSTAALSHLAHEAAVLHEQSELTI